VGVAHFFVARGVVVIEELFSQIEALVAPVVRDHGLTLVDLEWRREGRRWVLRLYVDRAGSPGGGTGPGVSIADCERLSREVGDLLDVSELISGSYDLQVSSPGLDRELKKERELRWAVGKAVRCWLRQPHEGRTEVVGRLQEVTEEMLVLEEAGGRRLELLRAGVARARLEFAFPRRA
jgi:ribosome maturation factor RimP